MDAIIASLNQLNLEPGMIAMCYNYKDSIFQFLIYVQKGTFRYQSSGDMRTLLSLHHWDPHSKTIKIPLLGYRLRIEKWTPSSFTSNEIQLTDDIIPTLTRGGFKVLC